MIKELRLLPNRSDQLVSIQYLRGLAAIMVVVHHARNPQPWLFNPLENYPALAWGVDLFFVISGFIMAVAASNQRPTHFSARRLIRVIPMYWLATLMLLARIGIKDPSSLNPKHIILSLFLIPHYSPEEEGHIWPFLIPGWTLSYELFFYGLFALGLFFKRPILTATSTTIILVLFGSIIHLNNAVGITYTSPLMLEFSAGMLIGVNYRRRGGGSRLLISLLPIGLITCFTLPLIPEAFEMLGRIAAASAIVSGAAAIDPHLPVWKPLKRLGDASYSVYLTHTIIAMPAAYRIIKDSPLTGLPQFIGLITLTLILSVCLGGAVYAVIERPMTKWLRARVSHCRPKTRRHCSEVNPES